MSNEEKKARADHQAFRKKWFMILSGVIALLTILLFTFIVLHKVNVEAMYIEYTECSEVDYKVHLKENDFYEDDVLGKGQAYIASLIEKVDVDFTYNLNMSSDKVEYTYTYSIDAQLEVFDNEYKKPLYNPTESLVDKVTATEKGKSKLVIKDQVSIDYKEFNERAKSFVGAYDLKSVDCRIIINMHINVLSSCEDFQDDASDDYLISLSIPLINDTTDVTFSSSVPQEENKVLACNSSELSSKIFKILSIVFAILDVLTIAGLAVFMWVTRDQNTDYASKVAKVLRNYKSYIQPISNQFDATDYQVLYISDINRLLEIRDTLQKPILFNENEDKTCSKFFIVTDNKVLYLYEIKVEGME